MRTVPVNCQIRKNLTKSRFFLWDTWVQLVDMEGCKYQHISNINRLSKNITFGFVDQPGGSEKVCKPCIHIAEDQRINQEVDQ